MTCVCMRKKGNINYHLVVMFIDYEQQNITHEKYQKLK